MSNAGRENYKTSKSSIRKINEAKKDNGLQLAQKFGSVVEARPKMNVYDPVTQNVTSKNVPELARLVLEKEEQSSATTSEFLWEMKISGWDITDPRKHTNLPIEKGQEFEFSRKDDLFDMNNSSKVARIVQRRPPPAAKGSSKTHWLQEEKEYLFELVSGYPSLYGKWPEIMAMFNEKHPSRVFTPKNLSTTFNSRFKKEYEAWLATKKRSSSEKKKSTKGATTSALNGAEAEMAVSASDKKHASKKPSKGATTSSASGAAAATPEKKRKAKGDTASNAASTKAAKLAMDDGKENTRKKAKSTKKKPAKGGVEAVMSEKNMKRQSLGNRKHHMELNEKQDGELNWDD
jgi:hypothetical protein